MVETRHFDILYEVAVLGAQTCIFMLDCLSLYHHESRGLNITEILMRSVHHRQAVVCNKSGG